ncbi:cell division protein FtsL [Catenulispora rubra]|uniref:cell division protein FtsL n=1 Tax=Catenulispora rubra TaxID=280293 RepID=UPI001892542E|nr:cell division protein FtsL [Catenulispora rubra]
MSGATSGSGSGAGATAGKSGGAAGRFGGSGGSGRGGALSPRLVVLAGRKGTPSLLPFVAVLLVLGLVGLLALLLLNTELNKGAFTIKQQKATATKLQQESEQIQQSLNGLDGPGALASKASQMGMVPNPYPAFLAPNGSVLGSPTPAPKPSTSAPTANGAVPGAAVLPTTPAPTTPTPTPTGTGR